MSRKATPSNDAEVSKHLSYILRHRPDSIGLSLDSHGWAFVKELLQCLGEHEFPLELQQLEQIVRESDKQRFIFSEDKAKIRASHGHSLPSVDLGLAECVPPTPLYHGTAKRYLESILANGLSSKSRQYVHLTEHIDVAREVGSRHGKIIILEVAAGQMSVDGYVFFLSDSGVWLTESVPVRYIKELVTEGGPL